MRSSLSWLASLAIAMAPLQVRAKAEDAAVRSQALSLVQTSWQHGLPFGRTQDLGPAALPTFHAVLRDPNSSQLWANAASAIGILADTTSFDTLRSFVWDRFSGEVDTRTYKALLVAQANIGPMAASSPRALSYLEQTCRPKAWRKLAWQHGPRSGEALWQVMSEMSIQALSLSNSPRAKAILEELRGVDPPLVDRAYLDEAIATNQKVRSLGLREFMRQFQKEKGGE